MPMKENVKRILGRDTWQKRSCHNEIDKVMEDRQTKARKTASVTISEGTRSVQVNFGRIWEPILKGILNFTEYYRNYADERLFSAE